MPIEVTCPSCGHQYRVPDERAGQRFRCKQCSEAIDVPAAAGEWSGGYVNPGIPDPYGGTAYPANPYAAHATSGQPTATTSDAVKNRVLLPAIFLYVVAGLSAAAGVLVFIGNLIDGFSVLDQPVQDEAERFGQYLGIVYSLAMPLIALFIIIGASCMQRLKGYGMAMFGAILATIPCVSPCCIFGMPFGIWALIVLMNPEVKRQFR